MTRKQKLVGMFWCALLSAGIYWASMPTNKTPSQLITTKGCK